MFVVFGFYLLVILPVIWLYGRGSSPESKATLQSIWCIVWAVSLCACIFYSTVTLATSEYSSVLALGLVAAVINMVASVTLVLRGTTGWRWLGIAHAPLIVLSVVDNIDRLV